jgi:putative spermidine/putrescine transport system ATP-binding protein
VTVSVDSQPKVIGGPLSSSERGRAGSPPPRERPVAIALRGLTKRYGQVIALDRLDLDVEAGEFLTLLGSSGCGKTTTLMLIAGFEQPDAGEIVLGGRSMAGVPSHKRQIGVVFQNYALFPHLNVFENVAFALRNLRWSQNRVVNRVKELLDLVALSDLGNRVPGQLSGGQQQRVAIARALAFHPTVLLLDEPLGALDRKLREHMLDELRRLHRILGVTMIYVTHDQDEALAMSDRVALMRDGKLMALGTPRELYESPNQEFAARFIGDTNILVGRAESDHLVRVGSTAVPTATTVVAGHEVRLSLRPERIVLDVARSGWVAHRAKVDEAIYLGDTTKYRLSTQDGVSLLVMQANGPGTTHHDVGDDVLLGWDPADLQIIEG